jgi:HlyD family secretion protein
MDKPREGARRRRIIRRVVWIGLLAIAIPLITIALSRLKPAAPTVERSTIWPDTVKRGPMLREVRGLGTLRPEEILFIPANQEGRVEKIILRPGVKVTKDSLILVLTNPELELAAEDLKWQLKAADANLADLKVKLSTIRLDLQAALARTESELVQARLRYEREEALSKEGLTPDLNVKLSKATADELAKRFEIDRNRLAISVDSAAAQIAAQEVNLSKLRAQLQLKREQVDLLKVRAGTEGVLQEMVVEVGQRIPAGGLLAKVAQPWKLKAEVRVPETMAKDVMIGQLAKVDTHNGIIEGKVSRIDPAVLNGTVTVDIRLEGTLPQGARPDLSVDGTIELERLTDVLNVQKPMGAQPNSLISLFRIDTSGKEANRVKVRIGRVSVNHVEIIEGLNAGDQVILSDMSAWDAHDRIRLN